MMESILLSGEILCDAVDTGEVVAVIGSAALHGQPRGHDRLREPNGRASPGRQGRSGRKVEGRGRSGTPMVAPLPSGLGGGRSFLRPGEALVRQVFDYRSGE